jgi:hypothetical protein
MIARPARGDGSGRKRPVLRARVARDQPGLRAGARWLAAVITVTFLWCNCALAAEPRVILLRGWFGVFSTGLDSLADDLRAKGIDAEAAWHFYWATAISDILQERAAGKTRPLVLVGHSQGANNVIDIARSLAPHNVPVDLLVTLAPLLQDPIPANVVRAINYYQSPGWGAPIIPDRGFHGTLSNIDVGDDWTISHINIDKSARVQADISREIIALLQAKEGAKDVAVSRSLLGIGRARDHQEKKPPTRATRG